MIGISFHPFENHDESTLLALDFRNFLKLHFQYFQPSLSTHSLILIYNKVRLTDIYLVRHGESEWNREGRIQGQFNSPLTEFGVAQAKAISSFLSDHLSYDSIQIYSSPLGRAQQTAEIIAEGINQSVESIVIELRLNDFNLGEIAGTYGWDKVTELYPELASLRLNNPMHFHPPGGESGADFKARIMEFMDEIADHETPKLLVSHGIVNKFIRGIRKNLSGKQMIELGESQDTIYHLNNTQDQEIKVPDWHELIPN